MSRLNFTPIDQAFTLGSLQIKDTQEEIAKLTKILMESNTKKPVQQQTEGTAQQTPATQAPPPNYMRIGYPDKQQAVFSPQQSNSNDIDYNLMKVIGHPKFDDIVKNYALIYHPEWLLNETTYVPVNTAGNATGKVADSKSTFGNVYHSTVCSDVQKYLIFFITSVIIFIILSIIL